MRINLNLDNINYNTQPDRASCRAKAERIVNDLFSCEEEFNGWVTWPLDGAREILSAIEKDASRIRELCDVLVVIGIGGSYLGTAAILEALGGRREGCPEVVFAGNNLSGAYHSRLL